MKYMILVGFLLLASSGNGVEGTLLARHPCGVELIGRDGSLRARVFVASDSVLLDFPAQQRGFLFKPDFYVYLSHRDKTYRVHSYVSLFPNLPNNAKDRFRQHLPASKISIGGFRLTGETDLIAGINAVKIVRARQDNGETELWVSAEVTPARLRAVGQNIRERLPANYWDDNNRVPTLFQAILLFGVPLRIVDRQNEANEVEALGIKEEDIPDSFFEIPSEYRQRE